MTLSLQDIKGTAIDRQRFTWRELVQQPISKLDDDAFTRIRIILMNGLELDSLRTKQVALRCNGQARLQLAELMRVEKAPYSGTFTPYTSGLTGWVPMVQAILAF